MKKFTYPLSDNDIQTLMDALAVMVNVIPDSDLFPPETIDLALFYFWRQGKIKSPFTINQL